jgi:hypothetical protein
MARRMMLSQNSVTIPADEFSGRRRLINRAKRVGRTNRLDAQAPANIGIADGLAFLIQNRDRLDQINHEFTSLQGIK